MAFPSMLQHLIFAVAQLETVKFVSLMLLLPADALSNKRLKQDRMQQDLVSGGRVQQLHQGRQCLGA